MGSFPANGAGPAPGGAAIAIGGEAGGTGAGYGAVRTPDPGGIDAPGADTAGWDRGTGTCRSAGGNGIAATEPERSPIAEPGVPAGGTGAPGGGDPDEAGAVEGSRAGSFVAQPAATSATTTVRKMNRDAGPHMRASSRLACGVGCVLQ